ncbi:MAG TPA: YdcF family protein [Beijerinckiaceae bacterium]
MFYYASKVAWFFATPSNLLPSLILLGALLSRTRRLARFGRGLVLAGAMLIVVAGLSPLANWVMLPLENRFPAVQEDGQPVAGIVVLGGALLAEESIARAQLALNDAGERLTAMADLARRYPQAKLVFTGGGGTVFAEEVSEAEGLRRFAGTLGLPADRIIFEDRSLTTAENARFTRALVEPKQGERWLLVTSAWHMPRAVGCFRQAGFPVTAYPVDFRTRGSDDAWKTFGFVSEGLRRLDLGTKEWAGLLFYRLTNRTDALFPAPDPQVSSRGTDKR